jgi:hypothetical protein
MWTRAPRWLHCTFNDHEPEKHLAVHRVVVEIPGMRPYYRRTLLRFHECNHCGQRTSVEIVGRLKRKWVNPRQETD